MSPHQTRTQIEAMQQGQRQQNALEMLAIGTSMMSGH
jgi:hypothetical protein